MPRTKKKTKNAFELVLGNTEDRSGHRRDCSQIKVRLVCTKDAGLIHEEVSVEGFLRSVEEYVNGQTFELEIWKGWTAEVTFNTERTTAKDVKEVNA